MKVKIYLHNNDSISELEEEYELTKEDAMKLQNLTYEVALIVDLNENTVVVDK